MSEHPYGDVELSTLAMAAASDPPMGQVLRGALRQALGEITSLRAEVRRGVQTETNARRIAGVLGEVRGERERQHAKWGEQNHPDGTGGEARVEDAVVAKHVCDSAAKAGEVTYMDILHEEVCEAFAESDPAKLRAELVQVAAVAVAWVEKIDRDMANR